MSIIKKIWVVGVALVVMGLAGGLYYKFFPNGETELMLFENLRDEVQNYSMVSIKYSENGELKNLTILKNDDMWWINDLPVNMKYFTGIFETLATARILEEKDNSLASLEDFGVNDVNSAEVEENTPRAIEVFDDKGELLLSAILGNMSNYGQYIRIGDKVYLMDKQLVLSTSMYNWLNLTVADVVPADINKIIMKIGKNMPMDIVMYKPDSEPNDSARFFKMDSIMDRDIDAKPSMNLQGLQYCLSGLTATNILFFEDKKEAIDFRYDIDFYTKQGMVVNLKSYVDKFDANKSPIEGESGKIYYWKLEASYTGNDVDTQQLVSYYNKIWDNRIYQIQAIKHENLLENTIFSLILALQNG